LTRESAPLRSLAKVRTAGWVWNPAMTPGQPWTGDPGHDRSEQGQRECREPGDQQASDEDPDPLVGLHRRDQVVTGVGPGIGQEEQDAQLVQRRCRRERQRPDERPGPAQAAEDKSHDERTTGHAQ
jgi:hypothetical protein